MNAYVSTMDPTCHCFVETCRVRNEYELQLLYDLLFQRNTEQWHEKEIDSSSKKSD